MRKATLAVLASLCCALLPAVLFAPAAHAESDVYTEVFTANHYLSGTTMLCYEYLHVGDWAIDDAMLSLAYEVSPLLWERDVLMRVFLNGATVYTAPLSDGAARQGVWRIPLPAEQIVPDQANELLISVTVQDMPCGEDITDSLWMNIFQTSETEVTYAPHTDIAGVGDFMRHFLDIHSLMNEQSMMAVPADASTDVLSAAMTGLVGVSSGSLRFAENIGYARLAEASASGAVYTLYITSVQDMPPAMLALLDADQRAQARDDGLITLLDQGADGRHLLLIAADEADLLAQAGQMLCNPEYMRSLTETSMTIRGAEGYEMKPAAEDSHLVRFLDVDTAVSGTGQTLMSTTISLPIDQLLTPASEIRLHYAHAATLDFDRSLVTAYINGVPVGSQRMSAARADDDTLNLSIPSDLAPSGPFSLSFTFDLAVTGDPCALSEEEQPWVTVRDTSVITLAANDDTTFRFARYPDAFFQNGRLYRVLVLLPQQPGPADDEAARLVMISLGQGLQDNTGSLAVRLGRDWGDLTNASVIAIGRAAKSAILMDNLETFPFTFSTDATLLLSGSQTLIEPSYGKTVGVAQMVASPYSPWIRCMMTVTGVTDEGMLHAARALADEATLQGIQGDALLANATDVQDFAASADVVVDDPPIARTDTPPVFDIMLPLAIATTLLLAALAGLFHFLKYRKGAGE